MTSISADTHKFGFAAKGTSVVLYRDPDLRRYQYYRTATWMGGLYYSPTFAGSRPGAISAECWAAMLAFGEEGYLVATQAILEAAAAMRRGIEAIAGVVRPRRSAVGHRLCLRRARRLCRHGPDVAAGVEPERTAAAARRPYLRDPAPRSAGHRRALRDRPRGVGRGGAGPARGRRHHGPHLRHDRGGEDPGDGRGAFGPLRRPPVQGR